MRASPSRSGATFAALLFLCQATSVFAQQGGVPFGVAGEHDTSQPVEITSDSLSVDQLANTAVFSGSVVVGQGELRLAADEVEVVYASDDTGANSIDTIRAAGNVTVTNGTEAAEGQTAVYRVGEGAIALEGDVVLTQGPNAVSGDRLTIDLASGRATIEGRVQTIVVPGATEGAPTEGAGP
jgi:lipopolysaccharide export system protein LptA